MEEIVEIILRAIDDASNVFSSVSGSAEEMGSAIEQSASEGSGGFDEMGSAADNASGSIQDIIDYCQDVDGTPMEDAASAADDLEQEAHEAADALFEVGDAGQFLAAETLSDAFDQLSEGMWNAANSAGTFHDSINRAGLEAQGAGISVEDMTNTVNELADTTGRAGGQIREAFINSVARGITDMDSFKSMMEGAGAQAYLLGTDVETMADRFSKMAMRSTLMDKSLTSTGITMDELATAMGMAGATADEVKEKWGELDVNQRAAVLGMAASMNEGANANNEYKQSWEGLQNQIDIAKSRLLRIAGDVLLPVLVPALELAGRILQGFGDVVSWVMSSPLGGLISVLGAAAGMFMLVVTGVSALSVMVQALGLQSTFAAIETIALAIAEEGLSVSSIMAAASSVGLTGGLMATATAAWGAATAIWAALAPLLPFIAAAAAVVVVIYEVGKAFGWWKDVNSMLQAIWAGIQRLWSAFINHPDVQAIIQALTNAWNWLVGAIGNAWNAVMKFLGISTGGKFDVVRAIIDGIGAAWNFIKAPIQFVIGLVQKFVGAIQWLWNGFNNLLNSLGPFGDLLLIIMGPIGWIIEGFRMLSDVLSGNGAKWGWLGGILQRVVGFFQWVASGIQWVIGGLTNLWNAFTGSSIVQGILNGITAAFNWLYNGIMWVVNGVNSFISAITGGSMSGVGDILSGIGAAWELLQEPISQVVQFITDFATAIWNVLTGQQDLQSAMSDIWNSLRDNVGSAIWSILELLGNFVLNAFQYAWQAGQQFVYNLGMWFAQLPGKVWNYLVQVKNHIVNVATQWVNQGKQKAQQFLMGVLNFLIQLPIRVKNYLLQVLSNIISAGAQWVSNAKSKASELVSGAVSTISSLPNKIASALSGLVEAIVKPFREAYNKAKEYWDQITSMGGARGGDLPSAMGGDLPGVSSYTSSSNEVSLEHNLNINLNIDAPGHINTEQLGEILSDRGFIRELVNNRDFQLLDSEAKERLNLKMNRARGV